MRAVDSLNPFKRPQAFLWDGPCMVSSVAGLGDLFIHLPLIAAIVNANRSRGIETRVALRPVHAVIGQACNWDVLAFDPALEDFFKSPRGVRPISLLRQTRQMRAKQTKLWIDLTGSAASILAIKLCGAQKIAARITRGGRSFVDYVLPHTLDENEYSNLDLIGSFLGCKPDHSVFGSLCGQPIGDLENTVVLGLTTICRWRNWPVENFVAIVDRFPQVEFVVTGFRSEITTTDRPAFDLILRRPNVVSRMDQTSVSDLIRLIAHARAVVTNDTSTAHIASAFRKPGAVLFGPASPNKLAAPYGLRPFVDGSCAFHPCVQWRCRNQKNWCMRKITIDEVSEHLADIFGSQLRSASLVEPSLHPPNKPNWERQAQLPV